MTAEQQCLLGKLGYYDYVDGGRRSGGGLLYSAQISTVLSQHVAEDLTIYHLHETVIGRNSIPQFPHAIQINFGLFKRRTQSLRSVGLGRGRGWLGLLGP